MIYLSFFTIKYFNKKTNEFLKIILLLKNSYIIFHLFIQLIIIVFVSSFLLFLLFNEISLILFGDFSFLELKKRKMKRNS